MSTELAKRSYVNALNNPWWQNRLRLHMHSSYHGQNGSQGVSPVVPGITTENASPKTHSRNMKWSCRNNIRQCIIWDGSSFPNSPQNHNAFMGAPCEQPRLGRWCLEPRTPHGLLGTTAVQILNSSQ